MDVSIDENNLSETTTICSQEIPDSNMDYQDFFANIEERIWQHTNKKRFFERTSIEHYLNALSTMEGADNSLKCAVECYTSQLQKLKRELDEYQDTAENLSNVTINFDHLTEDQNILRNIQNPVNLEEKPVFKEIPSEQLGSVMDVSESLFTNNDFDYSNSKIFYNQNIPPQTLGDTACASNDELVKHESIKDPVKSEISSKKRKFLEADLLEDINFKLDNSDQLNRAINDTNPIPETAREEFDDLDKMELIKNGLKSHQYGKLFEIPDNTFNNPEISTAYLDHFKSLMGSFQSFFDKKIDELIQEKEQEGSETEIRGHRSRSNTEVTRSGSIKPSPVEMSLSTSGLGLEDLSAIFAHLYENLSEDEDEVA